MKSVTVSIPAAHTDESISQWVTLTFHLAFR